MTTIDCPTLSSSPSSSALESLGHQTRRLRGLRRPARDPIDAFVREARSHRAATHPWLESLAAGRCQDPAAALRDFAVLHHVDSTWFPDFIRCVLDGLEGLGRDDHRETLRTLLKRTNGKLDPTDRDTLSLRGIDPATVENVPHAALFERFCDAVGLDRTARANPDLVPLCWRSRLQGFLSRASSPAAVGALFLGTAIVLDPIYARVGLAIDRYMDLDRQDCAFFALHRHLDGNDEHLTDLLAIARDLAATGTSATRELKRGMLVALDLRAEVFACLQHRALRRSRVA